MGDIGQPGGALCGQMGAQVGNLVSFPRLLAAMWEPLASQFLQILQLLSFFGVSFLGIVFQHILGRKRVALGSENKVFLLEGSSKS